MFIAGILAGILATFCIIFLLVQALPASPDPSIMVGQTWFINGAGFVTITKVLHTGSFKEFGVGVNVQYVLADGGLGHCTSKSLIQNGTMTREVKRTQIKKKTLKHLNEESTKLPANYSVYDKEGKARVLDVRFRNPR